MSPGHQRPLRPRCGQLRDDGVHPGCFEIKVPVPSCFPQFTAGIPYTYYSYQPQHPYSRKPSGIPANFPFPSGTLFRGFSSFGLRDASNPRPVRREGQCHLCEPFGPGRREREFRHVLPLGACVAPRSGGACFRSWPWYIGLGERSWARPRGPILKPCPTRPIEVLGACVPQESTSLRIGAARVELWTWPAASAKARPATEWFVGLYRAWHTSWQL